MERNVAFSCKPPAVATCDAMNVCRCEVQSAPPQLPQCKAGQYLQCTWGACTCEPGSPPLIAIDQPAVPEGGCAIVASIIVAGVKKALVACWIGN